MNINDLAKTFFSSTKTNSAGEEVVNTVNGSDKWTPKAAVTEKPVQLDDIAVAISAATVEQYTLSGANATAVEIWCTGDASFEGVEIVLNAANTTDAWDEMNTASGTPSLAYFLPTNESIFLPLANMEDDTLSLTDVFLGAVGSAVNKISMRFA